MLLRVLLPCSLGHFGAVVNRNLLYEHINLLIRKRKCLGKLVGHAIGRMVWQLGKDERETHTKHLCALVCVPLSSRICCCIILIIPN